MSILAPDFSLENNIANNVSIMLNIKTASGQSGAVFFI